MAVNPFVPQRAIYPQTATAPIPWRPKQLTVFPQFTANSSVPIPGGQAPTMLKPLPTQRQKYPQLSGTNPIGGTQTIIPIKPLPGGGSGGGGAVGSPIDSG